MNEKGYQVYEAGHTYAVENGPMVIFEKLDANGLKIPGVTTEQILAVLIDRMEFFQAGPYSCIENAITLHGLYIAADAQRLRTQGRIARGVEGQHKA